MKNDRRDFIEHSFKKALKAVFQSMDSAGENNKFLTRTGKLVEISNPKKARHIKIALQKDTAKWIKRNEKED